MRFRSSWRRRCSQRIVGVQRGTNMKNTQSWEKAYEKLNNRAFGRYLLTCLPGPSAGDDQPSKEQASAEVIQRQVRSRQDSNLRPQDYQPAVFDGCHWLSQAGVAQRFSVSHRCHRLSVILVDSRSLTVNKR
jgi:hypothetical protein